MGETDVPEPSEALGVRLKTARESAGLSIRGAAELAGFSEGQWRQMEKGYRQVAAGVQVPTNPRPNTIKAAAQVVGLDLAEAFEAAGYALLAEQERRRQSQEDAAATASDRSVGPPDEAEEEMVFRLRVPANATPRQREIARRAAQASVRAILEELDEE